MSSAASWEAQASADVVPVLRRHARHQLQEWELAELADDVELVLSELLANVVLHAPGPLKVVLTRDGEDVRLEVADAAAAMPAPRLATEAGTTGRGLGLVTSLTESWGFGPRTDGEPGKVVWCRFGPEPREVHADLDAEALLAAFEDPDDQGVEVVVGEAPTELVAAAKDHLDGVLRELALAEGRHGGALPREVVENMTDAVRRFAEARAQLRRLLTRAQAEGNRRVLIRFTLPAETADVGEDYLAALAEADAHARDRRMLSLESPAAYRVLREWYVRALVAGLRGDPAPPRTFEECLLEELEVQEGRARRTELAAMLQEVTSQLAAADSLEQISKIAIAEGMTALGATGGTLTRPQGDRAVAVVQAGVDSGLQQVYDAEGGPRGPSSDAIATGAAVLVGSAEERDRRYPHIGQAQPEVRALAALPLSVVGEVVGALRFTWSVPRLFTEAERSYLDGLAAQTSQAVARANALDRLRAAELRSRVLAELGERLNSDRSVAGLTEAVLDAVVPAFGDWSLVHLVGSAGQIYLAADRYQDPANAPALTQLFRGFTITRDQPYGAGYVIATGETQYVPAVDETLLRAIAPGDEQFVQTILGIGIDDGVVVPIAARGKVTGALSVGRNGAPMTADDIAAIEDIGRRAGTALDNAQALGTNVRLELALSAANVGSFEMRLPSGELDWDERTFAMLDIDPAGFDGTLESFFGRVFPEDARRVGQAIDTAVATVGELVVEYRVQLADGSVRWLEGRGQALPGPDGKAERLVGVVVDVTGKRDQSTLARRSLELMADGFLQLGPDWTLVYANGEAERLLRRPRSEMLGRSIWEAFPEALGTAFEQQYRHAQETGETVRFEAYFPPLDASFEVRAHPSPEGLAVYFTDVTDRLVTQRERDHALARLRLLNDVGAALTATLDVDEALTRLARRMVPVLGDLVTVDLVDDDDVIGARSVVTVSDEPHRAQRMRDAEQRLPRRNNPRSAVHQVLHGAPARVMEIPKGYLGGVAVDEEQLAAYVELDMRAAAVVPLVARGRVFGALSLIRCGDAAHPYTDEEVQLALELGRRAGLIVDNAAQFDAQRRVAEGLQRSLLPVLPHVEGVALGVAYEPSSSAAKVGGDWYDAFLLPDGSLGLVIGDVMGHDIAAAAAMGQLRSVLRTCAADGDEPETVVDRLDRLVTTFAMADLATVVYARLTRRSDGSAELRWSNAGHPPPLVLLPEDGATFLQEGSSTMIGVELGEPRRPAVVHLPAGATLLMYTDGLVERRGSDLDERLELVRSTAAQLHFRSPQHLCNQLIERVRREGASDDVALLALTLG